MIAVIGRWSILLVFSALVYLSGYNSGYNTGYSWGEVYTKQLYRIKD